MSDHPEHLPSPSVWPFTVDAKGNPILIYREGGKNANRALLMAVSTNAGASFSKVARINQGDSKVDS